MRDRAEMVVGGGQNVDREEILAEVRRALEELGISVPKKLRTTTKKKSGGLEPGIVLGHVSHGRVLATCMVTSEGYRYGGRTYHTLTGAADAARSALGLKGRASGWVFWGVTRRRRPRRVRDTH